MRNVSIVGGPLCNLLFFSNKFPFLICPTVDCFTTKKSIIAKRVRQITLFFTKQYCCCTKSSYGIIGPITHNLRLKKIAGKYFRGRIFSREDIFARGYFREKIFSREDIFA